MSSKISTCSLCHKLTIILLLFLHCIIHIVDAVSSTDETYSTVSVSVGGEAILNCKINGSEDMEGSWILQDSEIILTKGNITLTTNRRFKVIHEAQSDNWSLVISYAQVEDSGYYSCVQTSQNHTDSQHPILIERVNLKVIEPKTRIIGDRAIRVDKKTSNFYIKPGSEFKLTCIVENAAGITNITWYEVSRNDVWTPIKSGLECRLEHRNEQNVTKLSFWKIQLAYSATVYACVPTNAYTARVDTVANVYSNSGPYFGDDSSSEVILLPGQAANLTCRIHNVLMHRHNIIWKRYYRSLDQPYPSSIPQAIYDGGRYHLLHNIGSTDWTLLIDSVNLQDSGYYQCIVNGAHNTFHEIELIVVQAQAKLLGESVLFVKEGSSISMACSVDFAPAQSDKIYWTRKSGIIINPERTKTEQTIGEGGVMKSSFSISDSKKSDSGIYSCSSDGVIEANTTVHVYRDEYDRMSLPVYIKNRRFNRVTAPIGSSIVLSCKVQNIQNHSVVWMRKERNDFVATSKWIFAFQLERFRYIHEDNSEEWLLEIKDVKREDNNTYSCFVTTDPPIFQEITLDTVHAATRIENKETGMKVYKGSTLNLTCAVTNAPKPHPDINWFIKRSKKRKKNKLFGIDRVEITQTLEDGVFYKNLIIRDVKISDGGKYSCEISKPRSIDKITVDIIEIPLLMGGRTVLQCDIPKLQNKNVLWKRKGDIFPLTANEAVFSKDKRYQAHCNKTHGGCSLHIDKLQITDAGQYECSAVFPKLKTYSANIKIRVPEVRIIGDSKVYYGEGSTINQTCVVDLSFELPEAIEWQLNNETMSDDDDRISTSEITEIGISFAQSLFIRDARVSDSGLYGCMVPFGEPASVTVQVLEGPLIEDISLIEKTLISNESTTLICRIYNIQECEVSWIRRRDLNLLGVGTVRYTTDERFNVGYDDQTKEWSLTITKIEKKDSGLYSCQVSTNPALFRFFELDVRE